jgi:GNAT superfamily N-acetyltransferase
LRNPFVQIPPANPHLDEAARLAGFVPYKRPWVKFARGQAEPPRQNASVEIAPVSRKEAMLFSEVVCAGYGLPPAFSRWHAGIVDRPGWTCYLAWDKREAIGAAALFLSGDGAWLGVAATRPQARRRGSQSALLQRRISDAIAAGAALITTETGKPLEGEDHPSYRNIVRSGFVPIYERANWTFPA